MPTIEERLKADVKEAMKSGARDDLLVLRTLLSDAKNAAIAEGGEREGFSDAFVVRVLRAAQKKRAEAAQMYEQGGRPELAAVENAQIAVIQRYLPPELSDAELGSLVDAAIAEVGATSRKDMGAVMKRVMDEVAGRADGKRVSALVGARLG